MRPGPHPPSSDRKPQRDDALRCYRVALTQGRHAVLIDAADVDRVGMFTWTWTPHDHTGKAGHAISRLGTRDGPFTLLHRHILDTPADRHVLHRNDDTLDCRRANLAECEVATYTQRGRKRADASSTFRGVSWRKDVARWTARIMTDGHSRWLGSYESEVAAAEAYDAAALAQYGELARLNFPNGAERTNTEAVSR